MNDYCVQPKVCERNVVVDHCLSLEKHVTSICESAFFHMRRIAKTRECLSTESIVALVHAFVSSRLDR